MHFQYVSRFVSLFILIGLVSCRNDSSVSSGYIDASDHSQIAYLSSSQRDTTLLFIHGWCINKEYWLEQVHHFKNRYRVVAIDLPGFGASSKTRTNWDFNQYTLDIKSCIDQLKLTNVILIGHSMSGDILLSADTQYPDRLVGIIGIDNLHSPGSPKDSSDQVKSKDYFDYMLGHYDSAVVNNAKPYLFSATTPDTIVNRVMIDILTADHTISVNVLRALDEISQTEKSMMNKLSHPLLLVNSDVQPVLLDSLNAYCAKKANVYTVHATGHYPMIEKPNEFNAALQRAIWNQ